MEARRAKRRARSMLSQRKYRANQKASNSQLEADVQSLEMSNLRLEARRSVLHDRQGVSDCMEAVREFGRLFERGYNPASKDWRHTQRQEAFVRDSFVSPTLHFRGKVLRRCITCDDVIS
ncbi:Aste57867_16613 [Aphanomyces stellatus]|uniref:Aste57867_16613 protein n=1 Tax=Aphanomyces stellatus TaxID=120398 RepID=A0A485L732_9STRA|nr:hypothetical protein As57867_016556 [Aphanomyces stellatus]VFT93384.1 Aste57867_16613 [Aphanomyces stellatus]